MCVRVAGIANRQTTKSVYDQLESLHLRIATLGGGAFTGSVVNEGLLGGSRVTVTNRFFLVRADFGRLDLGFSMALRFAGLGFAELGSVSKATLDAFSNASPKCMGVFPMGAPSQ